MREISSKVTGIIRFFPVLMAIIGSFIIISNLQHDKEMEGTWVLTILLLVLILPLFIFITGRLWNVYSDGTKIELNRLGKKISLNMEQVSYIAHYPLPFRAAFKMFSLMGIITKDKKRYLFYASPASQEVKQYLETPVRQRHAMDAENWRKKKGITRRR